jgi:hypothetical protein
MASISTARDATKLSEIMKPSLALIIVLQDVKLGLGLTHNPAQCTHVAPVSVPVPLVNGYRDSEISARVQLISDQAFSCY